MNRLNKFAMLFLLLFFCLLINVSYAELVANELFTINSRNGGYSNYNASTVVIGDYTQQDIREILTGYFEGDELYVSLYNELINTIESLGNNVVVFSRLVSYNEYCLFFYPSSSNLTMLGYGDNIKYFQFSNDGTESVSITSYANTNSSGSSTKNYSCSIPADNLYYQINGSYYMYFNEIYYSTSDIYKAFKSGSSYYWDGESYYYKNESSDSPTMPTNSEIAQAVQAFYDSDLYKNNSNFKDFMVVYSFITGYYSIIGTDNHLLQEIYYDGAKPSNEDFTYPETWWRFYNYFGDVQNLFYGWDYWLYSTYKEDDTFSPISYDGVGKINDLFKLKFTNQSIIVYSSYEYKVYEFRPPIEEGGSNSSTVTTIPGDEYTYNENLDPTDSEYSPIQNYIPTNPIQTILGDVDFDELSKTFEENKDILNIENASWLFTANNQFVGYFIGFLSLLIIFLIIFRILGG